MRYCNISERNIRLLFYPPEASVGKPYSGSTGRPPMSAPFLAISLVIRYMEDVPIEAKAHPLESFGKEGLRLANFLDRSFKEGIIFVAREFR